MQVLHESTSKALGKNVLYHIFFLKIEFFAVGNHLFLLIDGEQGWEGGGGGGVEQPSQLLILCGKWIKLVWSIGGLVQESQSIWRNLT